MRAEIVDGRDAQFEGVATVDRNGMCKGLSMCLATINFPLKGVVLDILDAHVSNCSYEGQGVGIRCGSLIGQSANGKLILRHVVTFYQCLDAKRSSARCPFGTLIDKNLVGKRILFITIAEGFFFGAAETTSDGYFLAFGNLKWGFESDYIPSFGETF